MPKRRNRKRKNIVRPRILCLEGLYADTADLIDLAGGDPTETTPWNLETVQSYLETGQYHGILLTGGSDVNPALYGENPHPTVYGIDNTRDSVELYALDYARKHGLAVLGICRGSQIMCVSQGGKLIQDVQSYLDPVHRHSNDEHFVFGLPDARTFRRACGDGGKFISLHHQCVRRPGRGMRIAAYAKDGTVEAIESKDGLMLGVQFHPEMSALYDETSFGFFRWLIQTAARRAGGRAIDVDFHSAIDEYWEMVGYAAAQAKQDAEEDATWSPWTGGIDGYGAACGYSNNTVQRQLPAAVEDSDPRPTTSSPPKKARQAGDPAIPSMRDDASLKRSIVSVIEESTGQKPYLIGTATEITDECNGTCDRGECECELAPRGQGQVQRQLIESVLTCPECHIRFDLVEDRDDHCRFVHPTPPFAGAEARFPELEPPPGHPAWDAAEEDEYERLLRENGFDPRDWEDWG